MTERMYVETASARFHYARTGTGPPVLLVPGGGGWRLNFSALATVLSRSHTVYALDPPGQGRTEIVEADFDFGADGMAQSIGTFLDAVGLNQTAIVGHSWGGGFALRFAQLNSDRVTRLALLAPAGLDVKDVWEFRVLRYPLIGEVAARLTSVVRHSGCGRRSRSASLAVRMKSGPCGASCAAAT
jgi:pimeloyl-ACP methyl ester carboxylesterase